MSLTEAMEEAYAANPAGEVEIVTIELDHPTFDEPARIATGVDEDIVLPLAAGGPNALFKAIGMTVTPPGMTADGPTPLRLRIDNVSSHLVPYLRLAVQSNEPVTLTYRAYTTTDLSRPGEVIAGFEFRDAAATALSVEGTVGLREIELQAFPLATYDEEYYPAIQGN